MFNIKDEISDLVWIDTVRKEIVYIESRYHVRMAEKDYNLADILRQIIDLYKQELKGAQDAITKSDRSQVSQTFVAGDKKVFILKK